MSSGSQIAKDGFENEEDIIRKFNNWKHDEEAQDWLRTMQYNLQEIEYVKATKVKGSYKTDVQVQVTIKLKEVIDAQNIQVKLVKNKKGFNQVDKRWIDKYVELWEIPENITNILKRYTGEIEPSIVEPKDERRMFANEFTEEEQKLVLAWLETNKVLIISDILKGRGKFSAEWILVAQKLPHNARWVLQPINYCINHYCQGEVRITTKGNFRIAKVGM